MPLVALPHLWLDALSFGMRLLRGNDNPWEQPDELGLFQRDLAKLLSLEIVELKFEAAVSAFCRQRGLSLSGINSGDLEDLLQDEDLAALLSRGIDVVAGALGDVPLALALPGPGRLAMRCLPASAINEDVFDDLSLSLTDLVRAAIKPRIAAIKIMESRADAVEMLMPLVNLATHYDCTTVLVEDGTWDGEPNISTFQYVYRAAEDGNGRVLPDDAWRSDTAMTAAHLYGEVPDKLSPEDALAALTRLRRQP